ncbi:MAG TPA: hypothetical protein VGL38_00220 [bacterium]|jgi:hypothetical protein
MTLRWGFSALIGVSLLLAGCDALEVLDRTPRKIASLRKDGQVVAAKQKAVDALQQRPERMAVWRELAATQLELAQQNAEVTEEDPLANLTEAALLCAAMYDHRKDRLDFDWSWIGRSVAEEITRQADQLAGRFERKPSDRPVDAGLLGPPRGSGPTPEMLREEEWGVRPRRQVRYENDGRVLDVHLPDATSEQIETYKRRWELEGKEIPATYFDSTAAGVDIHNLGVLITLLERLPTDDPMRVSRAVKKMTEKLAAATEHSNLTTGFVMNHRAAARTAVVAALMAAQKDLDTKGHFEPETVSKLSLLE